VKKIDREVQLAVEGMAFALIGIGLTTLADNVMFEWIGFMLWLYWMTIKG
jgi:hypothetical protein